MRAAELFNRHARRAVARHARHAVALLACTSLIAGGVPVPQARAQDQAGGDPPARVGRIARLSGSVSMHAAGASGWSAAVLNYPITSGSALWTQPDGQVDVEVGAVRATLASSTELDVSTLDDHQFAASEPSGAVFLDIRAEQPGDGYRIDTPRGTLSIAAPGEYEILAGDAATPTRVAVVQGAATFSSGGLLLSAQAGQMIVASGSQPVSGDVQPMPNPDPFLSAMLARVQAEANAPALVEPMTGGADLSAYGTWQTSPDYGQVWYPNVGPDWVPYRDGHWSYVAPWGWTWIDDEPWGFAPFHYGRWAQVGPRWCWIPGDPGAPPSEPVYAPALVDFLVAGAAVGAVGALLASGRGDVGWVPLGPREFYRPPYGGSRRYLDRLNWGPGWRRPVWQQEGGRPGPGASGFLNRHALTVAPAAAVIHAQPIGRLAGRASPAAFASGPVQPLQGRLPFRPAVAHPETPEPGLRPAPGPAIRPSTQHSGFASARTPAALPGHAPAIGPRQAPHQEPPHAAPERPRAPAAPLVGHPSLPARPPPPRPEAPPMMRPPERPPVAPARVPAFTPHASPGFAPHPAAPHPAPPPHAERRPPP